MVKMIEMNRNGGPGSMHCDRTEELALYDFPSGFDFKGCACLGGRSCQLL